MPFFKVIDVLARIILMCLLGNALSNVLQTGPIIGIFVSMLVGWNMGTWVLKPFADYYAAK
jgi:hypothetical protein